MRPLTRLAETWKRLRPSRPAHALVRRWRARRAPRVPAVRAAGLPPLPPEARRPLAFPFDHERDRAWRLGGADVPKGADGGVAWDGAPPPTRLSLRHAHALEWVRGLAEAGEPARAAAAVRAWAAARERFPGDAFHPHVRSRRILSLAEAQALGVPGLEALLGEDAAALERGLERDARGGRLLLNGAALHRAGHALRGAPAARWRATGASVLSSCARDQVLADGFHVERSPTYHALALEAFLTATESAAAAGEAPPRGVVPAAARLAVALAETVLPDGLPLRWRDGAPGIALATPALLAWAARRAGPLPPARRGTRLFPRAGLAVLETPDGRSAATLLAGPPCPPDLPAHGHADALAYEALFDGVRVVASAGTSSYESGAERDAQRRPGAFAGVLLDGAAPGDPYDAFRVGARGSVRSLVRGRPDEGSSAAAVSDGFRARGRGSLHRRALWLGAGPVLAVLDEWTGDGAAETTRYWPLAPGLSARIEGDSAVVSGAGRAWRLTAPGTALSVEVGRFATALGATVERAVLRGTARIARPARLVHAWTPGDAAATVVAVPAAPREVRLDVRSGDRAWHGHVPQGTAW